MLAGFHRHVLPTEHVNMLWCEDAWFFRRPFSPLSRRMVYSTIHMLVAWANPYVLDTEHSFTITLLNCQIETFDASILLLLVDQAALVIYCFGFSGRFLVETFVSLSFSKLNVKCAPRDDGNGDEHLTTQCRQ